VPAYRGKRDFPGRMLPLAAGAVARAAVILEAFHCVEEKHVQHVFFFHLLQIFHVNRPARCTRDKCGGFRGPCRAAKPRRAAADGVWLG